jgi:DNA-binding transcriptional MerR regulator
MRIYNPGEAAELLGVSPATLRRMARDYDRVFEGVQRDKRGDRVFTDEVIAHLTAARSLREAGRAPSLEGALVMIRDGEASAETALQPQDKHDPMQVLADMVKALHEEMAALRAVVERQSEQIALQNEQLKALTPPSDTPSGNGLPADLQKGDDERDREVEDLHRRIGYLQQELERRSPSDEARENRRWWQVWKR